MTQHLAGSESEAGVRQRHANYLRSWADGTARMFVITADDQAVGGIGWWDTEWRGEPAHETGWFVVPEAQGRGVARSAVRLIVDDAAEHAKFRFLTAFPAVTNAASNALCAAAGFRHYGEELFPFRGQELRVAAWAVDLHTSSTSGADSRQQGRRTTGREQTAG